MASSPYRKTRVNGRTESLHRVVWERHHGPIPAGFIVHHINHDKRDNRIENLALMSHQEHSAHHNQRHALTKECSHCGREFTPHPTKRERAKTCSRECFRGLTRANQRANNSAAKVRGADRLELHRRANAGENRAALAAEYDVHPNTVSKIKNDPTLAKAVLEQVIA